MTLCSHYPYWTKERTDEQFTRATQTYDRLLADIPLEVVGAAVLSHIAKSRFFPTVSELRELAIDLTSPPHPSALAAWADKDDPIARKARSFIPNWNDRSLTMREESFNRAQFGKYYEMEVAHDREERLQLPEVRALREKLQLEAGGHAHEIH
jgi:hypothetical protein